ncbi:unnamed protein product [Miscanthus lutarioriparius]|uniref:Gnk2-homologous domain-containing protein n=1 Tax=Miscanthus lutarioriparius TaxID=422564 RepID=A0A811RIM2_9POAL|nr:unnamed protein product [Miscanthus lutarioriparius]
MASCLLLLAASAILFVTAAGQDNKITEPDDPFCSKTDNYTDGSQYKKNLDQLLAALPAAAGNNGWFYKASAGAGADEVFGLVMCFADRNATQCLDCLSTAAAGITTVCPGSRNVSASYVACVLRYSAAPIPATADLSYVRRKIPFIDPTSVLVPAAWVPLMSKLTGDVTYSPLRIANSSTLYSGSEMMYGLAQCTRDLNASECLTCISNYTHRLGKAFPNNTRGALTGYTCYLRYQLHSQGRVLDAADPRLNGEFDGREMESVLVAGLWCTQDDRNLRPSIRQVVSVLRFEAPLPSLPQRAPVAIYKPPVIGLLNSVPSSLGTDSVVVSERSTS